MKVEASSAMNSINVNMGTVRKTPENPGLRGTTYDEPQSATSPEDREKIEKTLKIINMAYKEVNVECKYSIDERTKTEVVKFVNSVTGETIKQYPPEEILNMMHRMYDMYGILMDKKV